MMKDFIHKLGELKFIVAIYFMALMILATLGNYIFLNRSTFEITVIWQIFGMAFVFSFLHYIQLSNLKTSLKVCIHCALSYLNVIVFSMLCGWGFVQTTASFLQFTVVFAVIYALIFIAFAFYYKNEETYLNGKLEEYKKNS